MKKIALLSEIAEASGCDAVMLAEFIERECIGEDRETSFFDILEKPIQLGAKAEDILAGHGLDGLEPEEVSEWEAAARNVFVAVTFMGENAIDLFHEDLVCYPPADA